MNINKAILHLRLGEHVHAGHEVEHMENGLVDVHEAPSIEFLLGGLGGDLDQTVREMTDEEAEAAFKGRGTRYFAIILLEARQAYMPT